MGAMSSDAMGRFLARTRQAMLLTTRADGSPDGVPIWFDWNGTEVRFFSGAGAPKIARLERDPRMALLVTNDLDEPPAWVRFEGRAVIDREADAKALAVDELAPRYWDLSDPDCAHVVEQWAQAPDDSFVVVRCRPDRIASEGG